MNIEDNIADDQTLVVEGLPELVSEVNFEDYFKKFDAIEQVIDSVSTVVETLDQQPHDQARIDALIKHAKMQNNIVIEMYNLMVEMSNCFIAKDEIAKK